MTDGGSGAGSTFQDWMNETSHGGHLHVECHRQAWDAGHRSGRADLEAARNEIAEARRQLFKLPVTYGNAAEFTLAAMVVEAQHEMAQRTLALNEARARISNGTTILIHVMEAAKSAGRGEEGVDPWWYAARIKQAIAALDAARETDG